MIQKESLPGKAQTVLGIIDAESLGMCLVHEHLLIDETRLFVEPVAASERRLAYEPVQLDNLWWVRTHAINNLDNMRYTDEKLAIKESMVYKFAGGNTIVEVTSGGIQGRDPSGLVRIARATGLNIVMGTGYHIAAFHPPELASRTENDITDEIIKDIQIGVGNTGIRAGIIGEIGCSLPIKETEKKILRCCAAAQRHTGAALYIHPSANDDMVFDIVGILKQAGADLTRVVIGHIDGAGFSLSTCRKLLDGGCNVAYDNFGFEGFVEFPHEARFMEMSDLKRINDVKQLISEGYLSRIFISQDIATKERLTSYGGSGYSHILRDIIPVMKIKGISNEQIQTLLVDNPKRILSFLK